MGRLKGLLSDRKVQGGLVTIFLIIFLVFVGSVAASPSGSNPWGHWGYSGEEEGNVYRAHHRLHSLGKQDHLVHAIRTDVDIKDVRPDLYLSQGLFAHRL